MEELSGSEEYMEALLVGAAKPRQYPMYKDLKENREIAKANLLTGELQLDAYMGALGRLSAKTGKASVNSNYSEKDFSDSVNDPTNDSLVVAVATGGNKRRRPPVSEQSEEPFMFSGGDEGPIATKKRKREPAVPSRPGRRGRRPRNLPAQRNQGKHSNLEPPPSPAALHPKPSFPEDDPLDAYIKKHKLPVEISPNGLTKADGDCWWHTVSDHITLRGLKLRNGRPAPTDPQILRLAVVNTLEHHPLAKDWVRDQFNKRKKDFKLFIKAQKQKSCFTDNDGIIVLATGHYLNVVFLVVSTDGDEKSPTYKWPDDRVTDDPRPVLPCGLYPDTSDRTINGTAGHWQSLVLTFFHES